MDYYKEKGLKRKFTPEQRQAQKEWRDKNKEQILEWKKQYRKDNKEKLKINERLWRISHPNNCSISHKKQYVKPTSKYKDYIKNARVRNIEFNLSYEEFVTFWQDECFYCGDKIETIGLDRVDNTKGYLIDNIVSCCSVCNYMKRSLSTNDFINKCKKIVDRSIQNG